MEKKAGVERDNGIDLLRLISTIAVILLHVNATFMSGISEKSSLPFDEVVNIFVNVIARFSVPVFVMVSGAFILRDERNAEFKSFYCKSIYKIFIPAALAVVLFIPISIANGNSLWTILGAIATGDYYNLWFLYMLAGLYLLTPFVILLKKSVSDSVYFISTIVLLCTAVLSQAFSQYRIAFSIGVVFSYLSFYLVGNVIYEKMLQYKTKEVIKKIYLNPALLLAIAMVLFVITWLIRLNGVSYYSVNPYISFFSPTVVISSVLIFMAFNNITIKLNVFRLSALTFYVYLFHTVCYKIILPIICRILPVNELALIFIGTVLTFLASLVIACCYRWFWNAVDRKFCFKDWWYSLRIWK